MNDLSMDCELIDLHSMRYAPNMISQMITDFYPEEGDMCRTVILIIKNTKIAPEE